MNIFILKIFLVIFVSLSLNIQVDKVSNKGG